AVELYRRAEDIEPFNAKINHHWGLALLKLGQPAEAAKRLRQAVAVEPRNADACLALYHALQRQGKIDEALDFAVRTAKLTGYQNADVLLSLPDAYAAALRFDDADGAIAQALAAARRNKPDMLPMIHGRGEEIRLRAKRSRQEEEPPLSGGP